MYTNILKISKDVSEEAYYELSVSNPGHIEEIQLSIANAKELLHTLPATESKFAQDIDILNTPISNEIERYIEFKLMLEGFVATVFSYDDVFAKAIEQTFRDDLGGKNIEEIKKFISNYNSNEVLLNLSILQEKGLSDDEIAELIAINGLFKDLENLSKEEQLALLQSIISDQEIPTDSYYKQILIAMKDEIAKDPADLSIKTLEKLKDKYLENAILNVLPTLSGNVAERAVILNNITAATNRFDYISSKITDASNHSKKQRYYNARNALKNYEAELKTLNDLDLEKAANLSKVVGGAITVISLVKEGFDVWNTGLRGEDWAKKMFSHVVGMGGIYLVEKGVIAFAGLIAPTVVIPGGVIVAGVFVISIAYEVFLKPMVEEWWEEQLDYVERSSWKDQAMSDMIWEDGISFWDTQVQVGSVY